MIPECIRKTVLSSVLALAVALFAGGVCAEEKIDDSGPIRHWEYTYFQSMITYVSPLHDYILTSDRKVRLVEALYNGDILATSIRDVHGSEIAFDELQAGRWVYVWGGVLADHSIGARDIVLLPGRLTDREWEQYAVLKERRKFITGQYFF